MGLLGVGMTFIVGALGAEENAKVIETGFSYEKRQRMNV
jgi:hypothetical protein